MVSDVLQLEGHLLRGLQRAALKISIKSPFAVENSNPLTNNNLSSVLLLRQRYAF